MALGHIAVTAIEATKLSAGGHAQLAFGRDC